MYSTSGRVAISSCPQRAEIRDDELLAVLYSLWPIKGLRDFKIDKKYMGEGGNISFTRPIHCEGGVIIFIATERGSLFFRKPK